MWWNNKKELNSAISDWEALIEDYQDRIKQGLTDKDFQLTKSLLHKLHNARIVLETIKSKKK